MPAVGQQDMMVKRSSLEVRLPKLEFYFCHLSGCMVLGSVSLRENVQDPIAI